MGIVGEDRLAPIDRPAGEPGAERGVGMPYVVAAVERSDALVRCGCEDGR